MASLYFRYFMQSALIALLYSQRTVIAQTKIDAKVDIAVVVSYDEKHADETKFMKEAFAKLPTYFETDTKQTRLAEMKLRLASLTSVNSGSGHVIMQWTTDPKIFVDVLTNWKNPTRNPKADWLQVFATARQDLFDANAMRGKVLVVVPNGRLDQISGKNESQKLREDGVFLYFIANDATFDLVQKFSGDPKRIILVPGATFGQRLVDAMLRVKEAIHRDLCVWESVCRFEDVRQKKCVLKKRLRLISPYFDNVQAQCKPIEPSFTCQPADCRSECDSRWPWENSAVADCHKACGSLIRDKHRNGSQAPEWMENCPIDFWCDPCPPKKTKSTPEESDDELAGWGGTIVTLLLVILVGVFIMCICGICSFRKRVAAMNADLEYRLPSQSTADAVKQTSQIAVITNKTPPPAEPCVDSCVGPIRKAAVESSLAVDLSNRSINAAKTAKNASPTGWSPKSSPKATVSKKASSVKKIV